MKDINELIHSLLKLREKHGNVPIVHNDIKLEVTGVSYKYLIIYSNYLTPKKSTNETEILQDS
jgi:hypothetical protein